MPRMRIPRLGNFHGALRVSSGTAALGPSCAEEPERDKWGVSLYFSTFHTGLDVSYDEAQYNCSSMQCAPGCARCFSCSHLVHPSAGGTHRWTNCHEQSGTGTWNELKKRLTENLARGKHLGRSYRVVVSGISSSRFYIKRHRV